MVELIAGDCRQVLSTLPDGSVHCCVTSPPYWGLRDYGLEPVVWGGAAECRHEWEASGRLHKGGPQGAGGQRVNRDTSAQDAAQDVALGEWCTKCGAWRGCFGLEPTPELYVEHAVDIFREVRRVLRPDGTLWLNLGDSYSMGTRGAGGNGKQQSNAGSVIDDRGWQIPPGLKPKDLVGIPWRVAFALQADGWYLRQDIIWHKPNPMPESVTDRCTKAHEYIFLLSKSPRYYYDAEAIREPVAGTAHPRGSGINKKIKVPSGWDTAAGAHGTIHRDCRGSPEYRVKQNPSFSGAINNLVEMRNKRDVWTVGTFGFPGAHFATFPPALIEPCILAGTSAMGCCPQCGAPWVRVLKKERAATRPGNDSKIYNAKSITSRVHHDPEVVGNRDPQRHCTVSETTGWRAGCQCRGVTEGRTGDPLTGQADQTVPVVAGANCLTPVPCTVLDPFGGSGTTGEVAAKHGRNAVLIELNPKYIELAKARVGLFVGQQS